MSNQSAGNIRVREPRTELMEPKAAPLEMLATVQVDTEGQRLWTPTAIGDISLELYGIVPVANDGKETRFGFYSPLSTDIDPDAEQNPKLTRQYPYSILPDGTQYEAVVRAPLEMVDTEWSDEQEIQIEKPSHFKGMGGIGKYDFQRMYPGVDTSEIDDGLYTVSASQRTLSTLLVMGRVANGEPLTRVMSENFGQVVYREQPVGYARQSNLQPETAVVQINHRLTVDSTSSEGDAQRLEFRVDDGFQRTGDSDHRGLLELIVAKATLVDRYNFHFKPFQYSITSPDRYFNAPKSFGGGGDIQFRGGGGLSSGETRYRAPKRVDVSFIGVRSDMQPIAGFRVALVGEKPVES